MNASLPLHAAVDAAHAAAALLEVALDQVRRAAAQVETESKS